MYEECTNLLLNDYKIIEPVLCVFTTLLGKPLFYGILGAVISVTVWMKTQSIEIPLMIALLWVDYAIIPAEFRSYFWLVFMVVFAAIIYKRVKQL